MWVSINGGVLVSQGSVQSNRWDSQYPIEGWTYDVSIRATAGDNDQGPWTGTLSAVAKPQLAPPPNNVQVKSTATGFTVTWDPPTGDYTDSIIEYNVIFWDWDPSACQWITGAAFKNSPAVITGLRPGRNLLVSVVTWNENGEGFPMMANNVVPGAGTPSTPTGLEVGVKDATSLRYFRNPIFA